MNHSLIDTNKVPMAFTEKAAGQYVANGILTEEDILQAAKCILAKQFVRGEFIRSPTQMKHFFMTQLAKIEYEVFCVVFLTTKNQIIACEEMFRGSINESVVHPREIVKRVLALNAASVILAHNHPSGMPDVSAGDKRMTQIVCKALALIDVRVLDHMIVGADSVVSFAEQGLL